MTYDEVRDILYSTTARYFSGATVGIFNSKQVKKLKPLVGMKFGNLQVSTFPNEAVYDGELCDYYPCSMKMEVHLFTNGKKLSNGAMANTAVGDLTDYVNFMASKLMTDELGKLDITVLPAGVVRDVSAFINDASFEYRAMVEFDVSFTMASVGYAGILDESSVKLDQPDPERPGQVLPPHIDPVWSETSSGGRNTELAEKVTGYFTDVKIEEMKE